jgi:hypothetical protein
MSSVHLGDCGCVQFWIKESHADDTTVRLRRIEHVGMAKAYSLFASLPGAASALNEAESTSKGVLFALMVINFMGPNTY